MGQIMLDNCKDTIGSPLPFSKMTASNIKTSKPIFSSSSPSPSRLWRPAAQKNIKNQWSKLLLTKDNWFSASSKGRLHATNLVNAYFERRYIPKRNLGVLKDIPNIREEACSKLTYNQELFSNQLLSSYKDMVVAVKDFVKASCSMRCYLKGSDSSPIIQYSSHQEDPNDSGDGGGIPVFSSFSITNFENLAHELVDMFRQELSLKRFIVIGLLSINCAKDEEKVLLGWSNELYHGEFDDLTASGMLIQDSYPIPPQIKEYEPCDSLNRITIRSPNNETLEIYLVTWISDLNIEKYRVNEIFYIVEEEMKP